MRCRICGSEYRAEDNFCPVCAEPTSGAPGGESLCAVCGSTMPESALFCRICGSERKTAPVSGVSFRGVPVCGDCGQPIPDGAALCPTCGARAPRPSTRMAGKKPFGISARFRRIPLFFRVSAIVLAVAFVALCAAVAVLSIKGGTAAGTALGLAMDASLVGSYDGESGEFIFADRQGGTFRVPCPGLTTFTHTADRSVWLLLCETGTDVLGEAVCSLTRVTRDGAMTLPDAVVPDNIALSSTGKGVAFLRDKDIRGRATVCLWRAGEARAIRLDSGALGEGRLAISPDGGSVTWIGDYANDQLFSAYISINGGPSQRLGQRMKPLALSDGAELVYFVRDGRVCVSSGDTVTELADNVGYSSLSEYYMTADCRQVIFNRRGSAYISVDGGEGKLIAQAWAEGVVTPGNSAATVTENGVRCLSYKLNSFRGAVLKLDGGLYYYGGDAGVLRIADNWDHVFLSPSGQTIVWESDGLLYRIDNLRDNDKYSPAPIYDAGGVSSITAGLNLKKVYLRSGENIIVVSPRGGHAVIAKGADAALLGEVNGRVYYTRDDKLYSVRRASRPRIEVDGKVLWAQPTAGGLLIRLTDGSLYITPEGKQATLF